jgi:hypothetical protein
MYKAVHWSLSGTESERRATMIESTTDRAKRVADELDAELARNDTLVTEVIRPRLAELAAISKPRTVRASARAGSRAHLAEPTEPQLNVLRAADNPAGAVSQNGSTGVTRPLIRALAAKGYGTAAYDLQRRHLIVGFNINDRGRKAARERFGAPEWSVSVHDHQPPSVLGTELCGRVVVRPNGTAEQCAEPVKSPIHDPAAYLAYTAELTTELGKWVAGTGEYVTDRDDLVHPFTD